jgi:protein-tyrosine phosphatase
MFETAIHWVKGIEPLRLGLMARPCGGEFLQDEVSAWSRASVAIVVSLLESEEIRELELRDEPSLCSEQGIVFRHFPIADRGTPRSQRDATALIVELHSELVQGLAVAIHCRAGIGRTGLVAGCVLRELKVPAAEVFHTLSRSRGLAMPDTAAQAKWVAEYRAADQRAHDLIRNPRQDGGDSPWL